MIHRMCRTDRALCVSSCALPTAHILSRPHPSLILSLSLQTSSPLAQHPYYTGSYDFHLMGFIFNLFSGNKRIIFLLFCYVSGLLGFNITQVQQQSMIKRVNMVLFTSYGKYHEHKNLPRNVAVSRQLLYLLLFRFQLS